MNKVYIGMGSNLGDKIKHLQLALSYLEKHPKIQILDQSSFYETEPVGYKDQDWFINQVIKIHTDLSPHELLCYCQEVEEILKRKRTIRFGPRTIDIDILLYEDYTSNDDTLTIPHPRMHERGFVLFPLYELDQNLMIQNTPIKEYIQNFKGEKVRKITHES